MNPRLRAALAGLPLFLAYLALPVALATQSAPALRHPGLWLGLGLAGAVGAIFRRGAKPARTLSGLLLLLAFCASLFAYAAPALRGLAHPYWVQELKPPAYLLLAWLWAGTFGTPSRRTFLWCGALLGLFCLGDLALSSLLQARLTPAARFGPPGLSACLLLTAFCAGLAARKEPAPGRAAGLCMALCLAGMAASLSRMALFTAGWAFVFFGPARKEVRLTVFALCLTLAGLTLLPVGDQAASLAELERSWQWLAVFRALSETPWSLLAGLPLDASLPLRLPEGLSLLADLAGRGDNLRPFELHAFWLHFTAAWGPLAAVLAALLLTLPFLRRPTAFSAGVLSAILGMGLVMDLFYSASASMGVILALLAARADPEPLPAA